MRRRLLAVVVLASSVTLTVASARQQPEPHDHGAPAGRLGTVHFGTSCAPAVPNISGRSSPMPAAVFADRKTWRSAAAAPVPPAGAARVSTRGATPARSILL